MLNTIFNIYRYHLLSTYLISSLLWNTGCTMHAQIENLSVDKISAPGLHLKAQQNDNTDYISVEEGTLILATALLDKARDRDLHILVAITSENGNDRVTDRIGQYTHDVTIPAGATSAFISIQTTNDIIFQGSDEFTITITTQEPTDLKNNSSSLKLIVTDNESLPELSFLTGTQNKNEDSGANQFRVELSRIAHNTTTVRVIAEDLSAVAGTDYVFTSQIVTFLPGEVSKNITFNLVNRPGIQASRNFKFKLTDANNATITTNTTGANTKEHVVTILDIDRPTLAINDIILNEGSPAQFTVTVSAAFGDAISVNYATSAASALAGTDFTATSGTLVIPANATSGTVTIATLTNPGICESNKTFKVQLSSPTNASLGNTEGTATIQDISRPSVQFSSATASVSEGSSATLTVQLSAACPTHSINVYYSTSPGTATSTTDFAVATNALVTIPAGNTSTTISIPSANDSLDETDETFSVTLADPSNATLGTPIVSTVTILDDDAPPTVTLSSSAPTVSEDGSSVTLTATLSAISGKNVSLPFTTGGTATLSTDYSLTASPLTINAGSLSATITLTTIDDSSFEGNETVQISLDTPVNATLGTPSSQTITINDNDLGAFTISGVIGSGDAIVDANLSNTVVPGFNWTSSTGATGYKIHVLSSDLSTTICAEQTVGNVLTYQYAAPDCTLSAGTSYRVRIQSTLSSFNQNATNNATNNDFSFLVNSSPSVASNGEGPWYIMAGSSLTINALGGASPTVGVTTDPNGDALSFFTVGTATLGNVTLNGDVSFTYAANNASLHGKDTISYTIMDARGGTRSGQIVIHVMQPYTWTGKTSSSWTTNTNWCGTISADARSCSGAAGAPGDSSSSLNIYFDQTCTSSYSCSPTTASNLSVKGISIKGNGFTQGNNFTISVGSDGWNQNGGAFVGSATASSSNDITTGLLNVQSGSFKSTKATLTSSGNLTLSSGVTFDHNSGVVYIGGPSVVSINGANFFNLTTNTNYVNFSNETIPVANNLTVYGGYNFAMVNGTLEVKGNVTLLTGGGYGINGSTVVKVIGNPSGPSTISGNAGSSITNLTIDSGTNPIILSGTITISGSGGNGSFNYVSSGTFTSTGSTVIGTADFHFYAGSVHYNNVSLAQTNFHGHTVNIDGNLTLQGGYNTWLNDGTLLVKKDIFCQSSDGYPNYGSALIKLIGNPSGSTITGVSACGLPSLEIDTGTYPVTLSGTLSIYGVYTSGTYKVTSAGSLTTTGSHLLFKTSGTFSPGNFAYNDISFVISTGAVNLNGTTFSVNGSLAVSSSAPFELNNGVINFYGNLSSLATGAIGSATLVAKGNPSGQMISSETISSRIPNLVIDSGSHPVSFSSIASFHQSLIITSSGTLTVPTTLLTYCYGCTFTLNTLGHSFSNIIVSKELLAQTLQLLNPLTLTGQLVAVDGVAVNMAGHNLSTQFLSLTSSTLTKAGGVLTVNGSAVGTGSLYGGTINP